MSATEALDTVEGAALVKEIVDGLEAELVRFRHRVLHDHAIELDRARAAMVLLGTLVRGGVRWAARPDSDPARIHEAFSTLVPRDAKLAPILKREIADFFAATADVTVGPEDTAKTSAALLRRRGAEPSLWWWAVDHPEPARCWTACGSDVDKLVQVALAVGVTAEQVARALAFAFGTLMTRIKTKQTQQHADIIDTLGALADTGVAALSDAQLVGSITKLAFEMTAVQQMRAEKRPPDPIVDAAIHTFQLVEALKTTGATPDLERFAGIATRAERMFASRGMQLAGLLRQELDEAVTAAIAAL